MTETPTDIDIDEYEEEVTASASVDHDARIDDPEMTSAVLSDMTVTVTERVTL